MIAIENITVRLGGKEILSDLSLRVSANEKVVISGMSGSGKSTLLRTLIGQVRPKSGQIVIDGLALRPENLARIRREMFYLPQEVQPFRDETVMAYLAMPFGLAVNQKARFDTESASACLGRLGLDAGLMHSGMGTLSGGERKRVGLAQALLLGRPILLLDELTSSVDRDNRAALVDLVLSLEETTVVAIAHDDHFIASAGRHVALVDGRAQEGRL